MPTYYDDAAGTRKSGVLRFYDDPLGVRHNLSGNWRLDKGTSGGGETPVDPNPGGGSGNLPLMFVYPGPGESDASIEATLGQRPQGLCVYVQRPQLSTMVGTLSTLVRKGLHLQVGVGAPNDKPPTYPNGSLELMKGLADGTPLAVDFWSTLLTNMNTVSRVNPNIIVKIAPIVEPETGYMQSSHNSTSIALGEPISGTPTPTPASRARTLATIGRFHSEFYALAASLAPLCVRSLWIGGTSLRNTERNLMFDAMPDAWGPQEILTDPYNNARNLTHTAITTWKPKVDAWRVAGQAHNRHWVRWGRPPIGLGETGIDKLAYADAEMVPWISTMYEAAVELKLTQVNYFNSSGPNGQQAILNAANPRASAAFSGEITQAKQALAASA